MEKRNDYHQINITRPGEEGEQRIESNGKWDVDRLRFSNSRLSGWAKDLTADPSGLTSVFRMTFTDGSGLTVSEIVSLSNDGNRRMRATQLHQGRTHCAPNAHRRKALSRNKSIPAMGMLKEFLRLEAGRPAYCTSFRNSGREV